MGALEILFIIIIIYSLWQQSSSVASRCAMAARVWANAAVACITCFNSMCIWQCVVNDMVFLNVLTDIIVDNSRHVLCTCLVMEVSVLVLSCCTDIWHVITLAIGICATSQLETIQTTTQSTQTVLSAPGQSWPPLSTERPSPPLCTPTCCTNARFSDASNVFYRNTQQAKHYERWVLFFFFFQALEM